MHSNMVIRTEEEAEVMDIHMVDLLMVIHTTTTVIIRMIMITITMRRKLRSL